MLGTGIRMANFLPVAAACLVIQTLLSVDNLALVRAQHQGPETHHEFHKHSKDDVQHQREHLREVVGINKAGRKHLEEEYQKQTDSAEKFEDLSKEQVMMRFFALHDYDRSHSLDGIELSGALSSYYDFGMPTMPMADGEEEEMSHEEKTGPLLLEEEVEAIVDRILEDHDSDKNGYLTFAELLANPDGIWNSLDMVDEIDDAEDDYRDEDADVQDFHNDS